MTFVILTGGIDLSVGSILALTGAVTAGMMAGGVDPILAMFLGLLLGAVLGAINGVIIAKGKVAPFHRDTCNDDDFPWVNIGLHRRTTDFRTW